MRILCFLMVYFIIQTSTYAFSSKNDSGLQFIINEDSITEDSYISLLIKNNSSTDYYLPIIRTEKTIQWNALFNMQARNFFFINTVFMTDSTGEIPWGTENCYDRGGYDFFEKYWSQKLKGIEYQNMILIKSCDSARVKMPVNFTVKYSEFCVWKLQDYDKFNRINVCFTYEPKTFDMEEKFLSKSTISKLKRMGYQLYTNKIVSDTVAVYINHRSTQIAKDTLKNKSTVNVKDYVEIPKGSLQWEYYTYCIPNLKPFKRIKTYPGFRVEDLCTIRSCFQALLRPEISEVMYKRLVEIARHFYKNKIHIYLISGKGSVERAEEYNRNRQKETDFIYISVDSFINSSEIQKRIDIFNNETAKLLRKKAVN